MTLRVTVSDLDNTGEIGGKIVIVVCFLEWLLFGGLTPFSGGSFEAFLLWFWAIQVAN